MATVTRENIGKHHDKLIVKISKEDYWTPFEKTLKNYSKNTQIPGFRKGHVPAGMVRKMYGQSLYVEEVLRTVNEELNNFLKTEQQKIFAQPLPLNTEEPLNFDMNQPGEYAFPFEIGVQPDIEITPLQTHKGKLIKYKIVVDDETLEQEVNHIQRQLGKTENIETINSQDDTLKADFIATDENGTALPEAEALSASIPMKSLPEALWEQLKDKNVGATVVFVPATVCKPEELDNFVKGYMKIDPKNEEATNSHYMLTVTGIEHIIPHEINEALFENALPGKDVKTEEDFRKILREDIQKQVAHLSINRLNDEIFEMLVHETPIDLPVDFLKNWLQKGGEAQKTTEEVEQEFPGFDHQLRWTLISNKLIESNQIQVSYEEVVENIKSDAMRYFGVSSDDTEDIPWMDTYVNRLLKEEKAVEETHQRLLINKLFDKLAADLEVQEQEIEFKAFTALPQNHHHH